MARPSLALVVALRDTASRLAGGAPYQWGHHGQCNCGHLVQTVCGVEPPAIHAWAIERGGDWDDLANDHCPASGRRIDDVIDALLAAGLDRADLGHLEELDDPRVLAALPGGHRWLTRNLRDDVVAYLRAWADLLDAALPARAA
jgi:hypothetical protein